MQFEQNSLLGPGTSATATTGDGRNRRRVDATLSWRPGGRRPHTRCSWHRPERCGRGHGRGHDNVRPWPVPRLSRYARTYYWRWMRSTRSPIRARSGASRRGVRSRGRLRELHGQGGSRIYEAWIDGLTDPAQGAPRSDTIPRRLPKRRSFMAAKQSLPLAYSGTLPNQREFNRRRTGPTWHHPR